MLPPGPPESPAVQTARWLARPIAFMESCRRRFGDAFSVRFVGFQSPMVMISHPTRCARCTPSARTGCQAAARRTASGPGPRSVLLLEGAEHLARRLMLPPFHGERMQAYEQTVREIAERDLEGWPRDEPFALHPRMQAVTLEVIMRAVFGVADPARGSGCGSCCAAARDTASFGLQFRSMLRAASGARSAGELRRRGRDRRAAAGRDPRAAAPRRRRGHPLAAAARASRTASRWTTRRCATSS